MGDAVAVILAAGKSTRMKSALPKVVHHVCGRPLLAYILDACEEAGVGRMIVVYGHEGDQVVAAFQDRAGCEFVEQAEQHGTGHAVLCCRDALQGASGPVLVIAGDMPLVRGETLRALIDENARSGDAVTMATTILADPTGYGRIHRDGAGKLLGIVEHRDCTPEQLAIREVNPSYYCFDGPHLFHAMDQVGNDNAKGEYYITDAVHIHIREGNGGGAIASVPAEDAMGINSRADLAEVGRIMQARIQRMHMQAGVSIVDERSTWIEYGASIGVDTVIQPFSFIGASARIGSGCEIGPFAMIAAGERVGDGECVTSNVPLTGAPMP